MKNTVLRFKWAMMVLGVFAVTIVSVVAEDDAHKSNQEQKPVIQHESTSAACLAGTAAVEDMQRSRENLEKFEKELAVRKTELESREKAVEEELKKLEAARNEIIQMDQARKKENEARVGKVIELLESMSPKSASQLLASLDDELAVAAMGKMVTVKLAKIMNIMEPSRSSKLSEILAGVARARRPAAAMRAPTASNEGAAAATSSESPSGATQNKKKGGEQENERNIKYEQRIVDNNKRSDDVPADAKGKKPSS
ncbi:MAG: hypothetical protein AABZ06_04825 [Bdellovibrionota bacterium]